MFGIDDAITAALITGGISAANSWLNTNVQTKASKLAAAENANDAIRKYNDSVKSQKEAYNSYTKQTATSYGSDFLTKLQSGASTEELIESIGGDTATGKQLQLYKDEAEQAVGNAMQSNQQTGMLAAQQGQENATEMQELKAQSEQALGAAASSEAASGIRSTAGTGANAEKLQEQANAAAEKKLSQQTALQNRQTLAGMEQTQTGANQNAANLRKQADITAQDTVEKALADYDSFSTEMNEMDRTQAAYKGDAEYYKDNAKGNVDFWSFLNPEAYADYSGNVNEQYENDTINFAD